MKIAQNNFAYIDSNNLHKGCLAGGFKVDNKKFRKFLKESYNVQCAYLFIGFVPGNEDMYKKFQEAGYTIIFKPTIPGENGNIKGNCDAELVLHAVSDFYEKKYDEAIIVSSDGDFACLVKFLLKHKALNRVLSPYSGNKCSTLLRKSGAKLTFLSEVKENITH